MQTELFPSTASFASTRQEALIRLDEFVPLSGRYSRDRNRVVPGHPSVSRLSPAIRHRLLSVEECVEAVLRRYAPSTVEKFVQELYWRRYWKSWLSLRPQVWDDYLRDLAELQEGSQHVSIRERISRIEAGECDIAIMAHFSRELVNTGYLHNHARMWFAGWWIHVERLPWQLGADFFFRHLLDSDPASNTLSWRWVAGLQTPGKTYLPRRGNLEKYVAAEILSSNREGLEKMEHPTANLPPLPPRPEISRRSLPQQEVAKGQSTGVWLHEEDLCPESSPLASLQPSALLVRGDASSWTTCRFPEWKQDWLRKALLDAESRASGHFGCPASPPSSLSLESNLASWAREKDLTQVLAMRPEVGPLADRINLIRDTLAAAGAELVLLDHPGDLAVRSMATGGFFGFWKKVQRHANSHRGAACDETRA